ncbi:MAG TPA: SprT family zinc-dependent metalloprotease [Candidatus Paceibacterota bacterium]|nr:SprT family zinc-dependent metalloprotease [Candidatus Paceibacterota bacterium]
MDGYELHESKRAKRMSVTVYPNGRVRVSKPVRVSREKVEAFVAKQQDWIARTQAKFLRHSGGQLPIPLPKPRRGSKAYKEAVEAARTLVHERLTFYSSLYGFPYGLVSIRNQRTRWGSCSAAGNLSFNYKIAFLPPALADYIVVHELCHTKEHNHSERFWKLVERAVPEHKALRKELRTRYLL